MSSNILSAFNDHFIEFVNDVQKVFPDDQDVLVAKNSLIAIRKANPKMIVKMWNVFIVGKYKSQIESGDISFFIDKDYSTDLENAQNANHIIEAINRLREPIKMMNSSEQAKTMKYIQNLTKLATMCEA
jgi:hypothetical protein